IKECPFARIVERWREVPALGAAQLAVVRPVAAAHAEFECKVRPDLPAVLREGIEIPIAKLAIGLTQRRLSVPRRSLRERADTPDQHVRRRIAGARSVVGAEPELAGFVVLEVLLLLAALDRYAELHAVAAQQLRKLVAEL